MSAISIITQKLLSSPELVAIVGDRIFPIQAPQDAMRPYIVLHIVDNDDGATLSGASRYYRTICQVDYYTHMTSAGALQIINLGDLGIDVLNGVVKESIAACIDVDILLGSADFTEGGNLEANTHRRYTQFSVQWRKPAGEPADASDVADPANVAFSITAAAGSGAVGYVGANHFAGWAPFGSVAAEPIVGSPLVAVTRDSTTGSVIAFAGNVSALLAGKSVWIDGVNYGLGVQYTWTASAGVTIWNRITGGPVFVAGQTYSIEIK